MDSSWVTEDGQVTIPKAVLELLGIGPGSEVEFRLDPDGRVLLEKADEAPKPIAPDRFDRVRGIAGPGPATDDIMAELRGD